MKTKKLAHTNTTFECLSQIFLLFTRISLTSICPFCRSGDMCTPEECTLQNWGLTEGKIIEGSQLLNPNCNIMFSCSKDAFWVIVMVFGGHQSTALWPFENHNFIVYNLFLFPNISFYRHYKSCLFLEDFSFQVAINKKLSYPLELYQPVAHEVK